MFEPKLNKREIDELRVLSRIIATEEYKLEQVRRNTAYVTKGQQWVKTQEGIVTVLKGSREEFISMCCTRLGIEGKVSVDLRTGKVHKAS